MAGRLALCVMVFLYPLLVWTAVRSDEPPDKTRVPATGKTEPKFARLDDLLSGFLAKYDLPGAALAVAKDGELVYSRAFGYSDREAKQVLQPDALFRISSITKPITATAVLRLIEQNKLKLDSKVMDVLKLRPPAKNFDDRWNQITIGHLLEHKGGWDSSKSPDPMFSSPLIVREMGGTHPATPATTIRYMLGKKLDFDPGEKRVYSNFGYCLLGRVIEKASGQGYEAYVKKEILAPLGITRMRLGRTLLMYRAAGEVRHHSSAKSPAIMGPALGKQVLAPYGGFSLESMDSIAGWLGSAPDLARFACALADARTCKILNEASLESMFARPAGNKDPVYPCKGWLVQAATRNGKSFWHDGAMEGSSGMLLHRADGVTFAILFNTLGKTDNSVALAHVLAPLHEAANAIFAARK